MGSRPTIVGMLGGIASGKSTVARILEDLGARRIDADRIAHEILDLPELRPVLEKIFGEAVPDRDGSVDRGWVADRVFADAALLTELEQALHPRVRARIRLEVDGASEEMVVIDAPLLLEAGLGRGLVTGQEDGLGPTVDCLVYVESPRATRFDRARETRGWSLREVARRENRQMALAEKRRRADYKIINDGDLRELRTRVEELRRRILEDRPRRGATNEGDAEDGS